MTRPSTRPDGGSHDTAEPGLVGDRAMVVRLWPVLLASALGLLPFTVFGTYLVAVASSGGWAVAEVGSLRGLGGVAALVVGVAVAPWLDRVPRAPAAAGALGLLAVAALLGTAPSLVAVAGFCLLVGAATSVLNPALAALASDAFADDRNAGRAATLVSATQSMTAMLAAPLVAAPSLLWGWRGTLVAVAVLAAACAVLLRRSTTLAAAAPPPAGAAGAAGPSYGGALRGVLGRPALAALLGVSLLRTTAFMGWLAYVAALYDARFGLTPEVFALVWTLSGGAFFCGNLLTGRLVARVGGARPIAALAAAGSALATAALVLLVAAPTLPLALLGTTLLGASHAAVAACVTTLLVRLSPGLRGTTLGLNASAQSLGVFAGAALGGLGLALGSWSGVGLALGVPTALAAVLALLVAWRQR